MGKINITNTFLFKETIESYLKSFYTYGIEGRRSQMASNKRKLNRREFTYYMQVTDDVTKQLIGYLSDISTGGFKLDCSKRLPTGQDYRLSIQLTAEIADKTSMVFIARAKWCAPDHIDPTSFNVGFEILNMAPNDMIAPVARSQSSHQGLWTDIDRYDAIYAINAG